MAYEGLENPVEGTMLTVMKETAAATRQYLDGSQEGITDVFQSIVDAAKKAVANTPNLLPVLKEAGVVDSGGQGLYILFEGSLMYLRGQTDAIEYSKSRIITTANGHGSSPKLEEIQEEVPYGYCTEFLIKGQNLEVDTIRSVIKDYGQSLIVTGDGSTVKVHIHCVDPSPVIHYACALGTLSAINIRNMDEQFADMVKLQKDHSTPVMNVAVVTVAAGDGIVDTFNRLGAAAVVPGGPTMNPSAKQILAAVEAVPANQVIILPNDKNLVMVANKIETLTQKIVRVIPTTTIPQGIAALLDFNPDADLDNNLDLMSESKSMVKTIEVTHATRSTRINGFVIRKGQPIGLLDGKLLSVGDRAQDVITGILDSIDLEEAENASLYYGSDTSKSEANEVRELMCRKNKRLNVEVVYGGQPLYNYIISVE
jgi:DAK2 domain fusion protein YloV